MGKGVLKWGQNGNGLAIMLFGTRGETGSTKLFTRKPGKQEIYGKNSWRRTFLILHFGLLSLIMILYIGNAYSS